MNASTQILEAIGFDTKYIYYHFVVNDVLSRTERVTNEPKENVNKDTVKKLPQKESATKQPEVSENKYSDGFSYFTQLKAPKEKLAHPEASDGEITQIIRKRWNDLDESLQQKFEKKARTKME